MPERTSSFSKFLLDKTKPAIKPVLKTREAVSPEIEYALGAAATITYTVALVEPQLLQDVVAIMYMNMKDFAPNYFTFNAIAATAISSILTVDGAWRIANERLPFYEAVLLSIKEQSLNKLSNSD